MGQLRGLLRGHRDLQRRRAGRGAARAGRGDRRRCRRDHGHRRRRPVGADRRRAAPGHHPHALGQRRSPAAAGASPRRQLDELASWRATCCWAWTPRRARRESVVTLAAARPSCSTPTAWWRAGTPPGRGHRPAAGRARRARRPPAGRAARRADRAAASRDARGRRRAGRRPAAPAGPAAAGRGRAERRPPERAGRPPQS